MSIRYWFPSDEELAPGQSGIAITDEDGGFIAGTMKCFAGLALAGVLAANALSAQLPYAAGWQGDERVVPATLLVDETDYLLPTPAIAPRVVQPVTDDDQFVSATTFFTERYEWPVVVAPPFVTKVPVVAFTDDDQYVSASTFFVERYEWPVVVAPTIVPRIVQAVTDDTEYVGYLGTDEDGWQPPRPIITPLVVAITDDDQYTTATFFTERYEWPLVTGLSFVAPSPVVAVTDDDQFVTASSFFVERYEWPLVTGLSFVTPLPVVALTDDDQYVGYLGTDEDGWIPTPPVVVPLVRAATDDAEYVPPTAATVLVDEDAGTWPRIVFVPPYVAPVTDDEVWTPAGATPVVVIPSVGSGAWIPFAKQRGQGVRYERVDYAKEDRKAERRRKRDEARAVLLIPRIEREEASEPVGPPPTMAGAGFTVPEKAPVVPTDFTLSPKPFTPAAAQGMAKLKASTDAIHHAADARKQAVAQGLARYETLVNSQKQAVADRRQAVIDQEQDRLAAIAHDRQAQDDARAEQERAAVDAQQQTEAAHHARIAAEEQDTLDWITLIDGMLP